MGPSGSGKSTLFAWMIGALSGDFRARGELWLNERRCDTLPTEHRRIGILFQDPLLFDHFSVGQIYSWRCRRTCAARRENRGGGSA